MFDVGGHIQSEEVDSLVWEYHILTALSEYKSSAVRGIEDSAFPAVVILPAPLSVSDAMNPWFLRTSIILFLQ